MVLHDVLVVLSVYDGAFIDHDLGLVPLAVGLRVLRNGRDHVVERRRLAVAVHAQLGVGMVLVVEHLVLGAGDVDRLDLLLAVLRRGDLLGEVENARVTALRHLPLELELEILELVREDQVAAVARLGFAAARAVELDGSVVDRPARRHLVLAVAAPAVEGLAVEDHVVAVLVLGIGREIYRRVVEHGVFGNRGSGLGLGGRVVAGGLRLAGVASAGCQRQSERCACRR